MEKKTIFLLIFGIVVVFLFYKMGHLHGQSSEPEIQIQTPPPDPTVQMYDPKYLKDTGSVKRDAEFHKVKGTDFKRLQHDDYVDKTARKKDNTLFYILLGIGLFFMLNAMTTRDKKDAKFRSNLDTNITQVGSQIANKMSNQQQSGMPGDMPSGMPSGMPGGMPGGKHSGISGGLGKLANLVEHNPELLLI